MDIINICHETVSMCDTKYYIETIISIMIWPKWIPLMIWKWDWQEVKCRMRTCGP